MEPSTLPAELCPQALPLVFNTSGALVCEIAVPSCPSGSGGAEIKECVGVTKPLLTAAAGSFRTTLYGLCGPRFMTSFPYANINVYLVRYLQIQILITLQELC